MGIALRGLDHARSVAGDCAVYGKRAFVKQVERPDIQRASGQVDARWRFRFDSQFALFPSAMEALIISVVRENKIAANARSIADEQSSQSRNRASRFRTCTLHVGI